MPTRSPLPLLGSPCPSHSPCLRTALYQFPCQLSACSSQQAARDRVPPEAMPLGSCASHRHFTHSAGGPLRRDICHTGIPKNGSPYNLHHGKPRVISGNLPCTGAWTAPLESLFHKQVQGKCHFLWSCGLAESLVGLWLHQPSK